MEFKGYNNLRISTFDSGKLIISSNGKYEKFISDEHQHKNYKLTKHIDFINWRISYHTDNKNNERIELRTYLFEENPKNAELEGYKKFKYENSKLINENHFIITGKEEKLEYEGKFTYLGKELVREDFHY